MIFLSFSFSISRDARKCAHGHIFCASCIFTWASRQRDANATCPVCRVPGRYYRPSPEVDEILSRKTVKCLEEKCKWTGILRDYRYHKRLRHTKTSTLGAQNQDNTASLPDITGHTSGGSGVPVHTASLATSHASPWPPRTRRQENTSTDVIIMGEQGEHGRITALMASFSSQLEERGRHINAYSRHRERLRRESLREVEYLGRQLEDVSVDLGRLLDSMNTDSDRYMSYIRDIPPPPTFTLPAWVSPRLGRSTGLRSNGRPSNYGNTHQNSAGPLGPLESQGATAPGHHTQS